MIDKAIRYQTKGINYNGGRFHIDAWGHINDAIDSARAAAEDYHRVIVVDMNDNEKVMWYSEDDISNRLCTDCGQRAAAEEGETP